MNEILPGLTNTRLNIAVWTSARGALFHHVDRLLIILATKKSENIVSKIAEHYTQTTDRQRIYPRWERLAAHQFWVLPDLCELFTNWDNVWEAVKSNLTLNQAVSN